MYFLLKVATATWPLSDGAQASFPETKGLPSRFRALPPAPKQQALGQGRWIPDAWQLTQRLSQDKLQRPRAQREGRLGPSGSEGGGPTHSHAGTCSPRPGLPTRNVGENSGSVPRMRRLRGERGRQSSWSVVGQESEPCASVSPQGRLSFPANTSLGQRASDTT